VPEQDIFVLLTVHYFISFVPIAQQAGQAAVLARLSLSVCLGKKRKRGILVSQLFAKRK
jgi:hypothetical protein